MLIQLHTLIQPNISIVSSRSAICHVQCMSNEKRKHPPRRRTNRVLTNNPHLFRRARLKAVTDLCERQRAAKSATALLRRDGARLSLYSRQGDKPHLYLGGTDSAKHGNCNKKVSGPRPVWIKKEYDLISIGDSDTKQSLAAHRSVDLRFVCRLNNDGLQPSRTLSLCQSFFVFTFTYCDPAVFSSNDSLVFPFTIILLRFSLDNQPCGNTTRGNHDNHL